jgi:molecular chaperone DnaK
MTYQLGIDLGTTYTAAAISRATERSPGGGVDVVTLGARSATVASVMYLADDGSVLVGEAAERRALTDPDRVVREFKRRIGDDVPIMLGSRQYQAHELAARMTRWVVDLVTEREGGPPKRIAVTHPASWGAHKKDVFASALRTVGLSVTFLAEPQAAAVSYACAERVDSGSTVAVYDLGGGTFDAAVVRKTAGPMSGSFELLGQPEGIERLGGIDFDEVVFGFVREAVGDKLDALDPEDPDVLSAVARLRREVVEAKEALSSDTEVTIPVLLPDLRTQTRLTRGEFEAMIRPALEETIVSLRRAITSAGLTPDDLSAVLLVGGSSRIPLVSQLVSDELTRPVAVDADPKTAIAMGAALAISPQPVQAPPPIPQGRPQRGGPPPAAMSVQRSGGYPVAGPVAAYAGAGRPGGQQGPGGPSGGPPPRPAMGRAEPPPPRSDTRPGGYSGGGGQGDYFAMPPKRKQTGMWIGIGGLVAVAAILAVVLGTDLFSTSTSTTGVSNSATTTEAPASTPTTTAKATSSSHSTHTTHHTTPRTTQESVPTTTAAPTTREHKPSRTEEPSRTNNPSDSGTTGGDTSGATPSGGTPGGGTTSNTGSGSGNGDSPSATTSDNSSGSGASSNNSQAGSGDSVPGSDSSSGGTGAATSVQHTNPTADAPGSGWSQPQPQSGAGTDNGGSTGWAQPNSLNRSVAQPAAEPVGSRSRPV